MRYQETSLEIRQQHIEKINRRWHQLNDLLLGTISEGMKYLFLINAGGCVAMLTFISTAEGAQYFDWPWIVLGLFFSGLVLIGMLHFGRYHAFKHTHASWDRSAAAYYSGAVDFENIVAADDRRIRRWNCIAWLAHLSFLCFVLGGIYGFVNYKEVTKGDEPMIGELGVEFSEEQKNHVPKMPPSPPPEPKSDPAG